MSDLKKQVKTRDEVIITGSLLEGYSIRAGSSQYTLIDRKGVKCANYISLSDCLKGLIKRLLHERLTGKAVTLTEYLEAHTRLMDKFAKAIPI